MAAGEAVVVTSGSPTPTTATSGRYRAFYEQPEPVVFDVELPDDIDGPDDLRDYLLDDAPFAKVSAVRVEPVGQDGPVRTPGVAVERLDPGSEGAGTPEAARGDSAAEPEEDFNDERHDLAMVIHDGGCQCRGHTLGWTIRARDSLQLADAVLAAGFRRVPEDAETDSESLADRLSQLGSSGYVRVARGVSVSGGGEQPEEPA